MVYSRIDEIRFWSNVNVSKNNNGCWYWRKCTHQYGYGWFRINKKTYLAHRLALIFYNNGIELPDMQVLHSCDNPACCNPKHLRWGTAKENVRDEIEHGNKADPPHYYGEKHPFSKLKWKDVDKIRRMRSLGIIVPNIAHEYKVSTNTIYRILSFKNWKLERRKEGQL